MKELSSGRMVASKLKMHRNFSMQCLCSDPLYMIHLLCSSLT